MSNEVKFTFPTKKPYDRERFEKEIATCAEFHFFKNFLSLDDKKRKTTDPLDVMAGFCFKAFDLRVIPPEKWDSDDKKISLIRWFNPLTSMWERADFILSLSLGSAIKYNDGMLSKFYANIFELIRGGNGDTYTPEPYKGSRYHVYLNGIWDTKTKKMLTFDLVNGVKSGKKYLPRATHEPVIEQGDKMVSLLDIGFTDKHLHQFNLIENPELPHYAGSSITKNKDWNPKDWLLKLANGRKDVVKYILELLGTMLTPNHSFDAIIEINGQSSSGKTTLVEFVRHIYGDNNESIPADANLDDLNDTFPFRGVVNEGTALVHVTEANGSGVNARAISLINSFANESMLMKQMGSKSVKLSPPPILVIEGVGWLMFDNTKSGISRRLLPLDLTESKTNEYWAEMGKNVLKQPDVIAWMAWQIENAYSNMVNGSENYKYQIYDVNTLPKFAREWHKMAVNAGDSLMMHFMQRIMPTLKDSGYLPTPLMYEIYNKSVELEVEEVTYKRSSNSFKNALKIYLGETYNVVEISEMEKHTEEELAISFFDLKKQLELPRDALEYQASKYNAYTMPGWFKISKNKNEISEQDKEVDWFEQL